MRIKNKFLVTLSLLIFALFSQSASAGCAYPDGKCASAATEETAEAAPAADEDASAEEAGSEEAAAEEAPAE